MIDVTEISDLHKTTIRRWHQCEIDDPFEDFMLLVCRQHQQNYRLWHQEDVARSPKAGAAELARVKRNIDRMNQQRNDLIEQLDDCLIRELAAQDTEAPPDAPLNTETPGSVIDRLSILSLRIYHMEEQAQRADAGEEHREKVRTRLKILLEQHADLTTSLSQLLGDVFSGRKRLKVYRQFKMYNDPALNPHIYQAGQ